MLNAKSENAINHLFALEEDITVAAAAFNLRLKRSASGLRAHLETVPAPLIISIAGNLENLLGNFATCASKGIDPWDDGEFFRLSMTSLGLTFPSDFVDRIKPGDLIEGYDMNRFQIFRNMRFMELSSYSLTEILSFEWPQLFDRAHAITERMISFCDKILWEANRTIDFDIPVHFIRELRSKEKQLLEVNFKYMTPLFSGPNQPYGLLGTCRVRTVSAETKLDNLAFV